MVNISRRAFIAASSAFAGMMALPRLSFAADAKESPNTKALVDSGDLPPVSDRLPVNPLVVTPLERPGQHGGDWNHALVGGGLVMLVRYQGYEPLVRFNSDWTGVVNNVAEEWSVNPEATEYTFKLRKGHKWSDGEPYTTADVQFWYDAYFMDEDTNIGGNSWWYTNGDPAELEVIDEQTFKVKFSAPNGFFVQQLAWAQQDQLVLTPKHYLEKFHIRYNPDADKLAEEEGVEGWIANFQNKTAFIDSTAFFGNPDRPSLMAWTFDLEGASAPGQSTEQAIAVRNPYYFKVDTEGAQLPYFDRIVYQVVGDPEVLLLKALQGEVDMMDQYIATPSNKPVLFEAQERGDYGFYTLSETAANVMVFQLNLNHTDPIKNKLFNNLDFRHAMSIAVDRQALIDAVFVGQGEPAQASIRQGDPLYNERLAKEWTEYDPDKANEMLDAILPNKDGDGYRLDESGERLTILFELDQSRTTFIDMFQLVVPMYQRVGIDAQVRTMDRTLWDTRVRRGREFDGTAHQFGANSGVAAMLDARYFVPFSENSLYAPGWSLYFLDPENPDAVEPPADIKAQQDLYAKLLSTADEAGQIEVMSQILENAADLFMTWGVTLPPDSYGVVKNDMVNVPEQMPNSFGWPTPGPAMPEQFFKS